MSVCSHWDTEGAGQSEVSQLQVVVLPVDEQVLRLQITMKYPMHMAVCNALQHLVEVQLHVQRPAMSASVPEGWTCQGGNFQLLTFSRV